MKINNNNDEYIDTKADLLDQASISLINYLTKKYDQQAKANGFDFSSIYNPETISDFLENADLDCIWNDCNFQHWLFSWYHRNHKINLEDCDKALLYHMADAQNKCEEWNTDTLSKIDLERLHNSSSYLNQDRLDSGIELSDHKLTNVFTFEQLAEKDLESFEHSDAVKLVASLYERLDKANALNQ